MTRKESHALLEWMRETGCPIKFEHSWKKQAESEGTEHNCIVDTTILYARAYDDCITVTGAGHGAIDNTFEQFYREVRYSTLLEKLPYDFYTWGL